MNDISRLRLGAIIEGLCDQAGCDDKTRKKHYKQFFHRWNPHPPPQFVGWWMPSERDAMSGASIGGHPDARRIWARKDPDGYKRRTYGISAESAFNCVCYKEEYEAWVLAGCPERPKPFVSLAATLDRQQQFWHNLKKIIRQIGKPMPKVTEGDIALESGGEEVPF